MIAQKKKSLIAILFLLSLHLIEVCLLFGDSLELAVSERDVDVLEGLGGSALEEVIQGGNGNSVGSIGRNLETSNDRVVLARVVLHKGDLLGHVDEGLGLSLALVVLGVNLEHLLLGGGPGEGEGNVIALLKTLSQNNKKNKKSPFEGHGGGQRDALEEGMDMGDEEDGGANLVRHLPLVDVVDEGVRSQIVLEEVRIVVLGGLGPGPAVSGDSEHAGRGLEAEGFLGREQGDLGSGGVATRVGDELGPRDLLPESFRESVLPGFIEPVIRAEVQNDNVPSWLERVGAKAR